MDASCARAALNSRCIWKTRATSTSKAHPGARDMDKGYGGNGDGKSGNGSAGTTKLRRSPRRHGEDLQLGKPVAARTSQQGMCPFYRVRIPYSATRRLALYR